MAGEQGFADIAAEVRLHVTVDGRFVCKECDDDVTDLVTADRATLVSLHGGAACHKRHKPQASAVLPCVLAC